MTTVVVSQPMFLPWIGLFEQIRLADVFVHYDDVQLPQGRSFMSRVQVKGANGSFWMTAPIDRKRSGHLISECQYVDDAKWRAGHLLTLKHNYARAPAFAIMYRLAEEIYAYSGSDLAGFNQNAIEVLASFLGLSKRFERSSALSIGGSSSQRLIDICHHFGASTYVTGHGAMRYLDHAAFESVGIRVEYMDYVKQPYPQLHGEFTPFVTVLDAIANCGADAAGLLSSGTRHWQSFVAG